jgi:hypothetical protein
MESLKRELHKDFSEIQRELQDLTKQIDAGFSIIDKDLKMNSLLDLIGRQTSQMDSFHVLVNATSDSPDFPQRVSKFIDEYMRQNLEDRMVNLIDTGTPGTTSLVEALTRAVKKQANAVGVTLSSSPNRVIYDFYMSLLFNVFKGYYFMESCSFMKDIVHSSESKLL